MFVITPLMLIPVGSGVCVGIGGTGVGVGGTGIGVGDSGVAAGAPHPTANNITNTTPIISWVNFLGLILHSFCIGYHASRLMVLAKLQQRGWGYSPIIIAHFLQIASISERQRCCPLSLCCVAFHVELQN